GGGCGEADTVEPTAHRQALGSVGFIPEHFSAPRRGGTHERVPAPGGIRGERLGPAAQLGPSYLQVDRPAGTKVEAGAPVGG
ncbi:unnamed protein product, partial [Ascophyllum nodosum]